MDCIIPCIILLMEMKFLVSVFSCMSVMLGNSENARKRLSLKKVSVIRLGFICRRTQGKLNWSLIWWLGTIRRNMQYASDLIVVVEARRTYLDFGCS